MKSEITDEDISLFLAATNSSDCFLARQYLEASGSDVHVATMSYFMNNEAGDESPRRSSRIAAKTKKKPEVIDLTSPSPKKKSPKKDNENKRTPPGTSSSSPFEIGQRLDAEADALYKSLSEPANVQTLERIAQKLKEIAQELKSYPAPRSAPDTSFGIDDDNVDWFSSSSSFCSLNGDSLYNDDSSHGDASDDDAPTLAKGNESPRVSNIGSHKSRTTHDKCQTNNRGQSDGAASKQKDDNKATPHTQDPPTASPSAQSNGSRPGDWSPSPGWAKRKGKGSGDSLYNDDSSHGDASDYDASISAKGSKSSKDSNIGSHKSRTTHDECRANNSDQSDGAAPKQKDDSKATPQAQAQPNGSRPGYWSPSPGWAKRKGNRSGDSLYNDESSRCDASDDDSPISAKGNKSSKVSNIASHGSGTTHDKGRANSDQRDGAESKQKDDSKATPQTQDPPTASPSAEHTGTTCNSSEDYSYEDVQSLDGTSNDDASIDEQNESSKASINNSYIHKTATDGIGTKGSSQSDGTASKENGDSSTTTQPSFTSSSSDPSNPSSLASPSGNANVKSSRRQESTDAPNFGGDSSIRGNSSRSPGWSKPGGMKASTSSQAGLEDGTGNPPHNPPKTPQKSPPKPDTPNIGSSTSEPHDPRVPPKLAFLGDSKENVPNFSNKSDHGARSKQAFQYVLTPTKHAGKSPIKTKRRISIAGQAESANNVLQANKSGKGAYYAVLGVQPSASVGDIKKAYRKKVVKVHPDHNKTPNAAAAFRVLLSAYEVLKSPTKRAVYDRNNNMSDASSIPRSDAPKYMPGSSPFNTISVETLVTILDPFSMSYGVNGLIQGFNSQTGKYRILLGCSVIEVMPYALLQNSKVKLRGVSGHVGSATIVSCLPEFDQYAARCVSSNGKEFTKSLFSSDFIICNGTIVRLEGLHRVEYNGRYGRVVSWGERIETNGTDTSYYDIQMSPAVILRAKMANVCL